MIEENTGRKEHKNNKKEWKRRAVSTLFLIRLQGRFV